MSDKHRLTLLCVFSLLASARCTFPDYDVIRPGSGGEAAGTGGVSAPIGGSDVTAGNGGVTASNGGGGQSGNRTDPGQAGVGAPGMGGDGDGGEPAIGGGGPLCPGEQWPVEHCPDECLLRFPDHCYDGVKGDGEVAVDCGGSCQGCSNEACEHDGDCLSGACVATADGHACHAPLTVSITPQGVSRYVGTTNYRLNINNAEPADGDDFALKDLKLRYYIASSGLVEPLLVQSTQSSQMLATGGSRSLPLTAWSIVRIEPLTDAQYDAYIEVSFADSVRLFPGDSVDLYQQLSTGLTGSSNFDQLANYSFKDKPDSQWRHVTLYYRDRLIWGLEPRPANPRACFARAVKLSGSAVNIGGHDWPAASATEVTTTGSSINQSSATFPATSGDTATLLASGTRLATGQTLDWTVADGTYLVYLHAISSGTEGSASLFSLQGSQPESSAGFRAQMISNAGAWARLGPYRVDVSTGKLTVAVTRGAMTLAGIELWYPQ